MANHYYFRDRKDSKGNHEVHIKNCEHGPDVLNATYIGYKDDCFDAIKSAKKDYPSKKFDGCYYCANPCHNG